MMCRVTGWRIFRRIEHPEGRADAQVQLPAHRRRYTWPYPRLGPLQEAESEEFEAFCS